MKAWRVEKHGGREATLLADLPKPEPRAGEVRVRVAATGLNHLDLWVRKGVPGHKFPLPLTLGTDSAGTIDAFGPGDTERLVPGLKVGSRVLVSPGVSCGRCEACLGGFDPLCPAYGILGETCDGGLSEYMVVPFANLIPLPDSMSFETAAALPIPFMTAWTMIFRKIALRAGETILIHAGGSGVSVAAIQMAKMIGATVITTLGRRENEAKVRALGADHVIFYREEPFREGLKRILKPMGKRGVEAVIDHVGQDTFEDSVKSLAWGGRLACCGATSGSDVSLDLKVLFFKNIALHGATMGSKADLIRVVQLVGEGKLKPVIDTVVGFNELPEALDRIEARSVFGKMIVREFKAIDYSSRSLSKK